MENSYYIYNISNILKRKETTVLNAIPGTDNELNSIEGYNTHAAGSYGNHAEGISTVTVGIQGEHSEGVGSYVCGGGGGHAEGQYTCAAGAGGEHAEGNYTYAGGGGSCHAEGSETIANGMRAAHAEGYRTESLGDATHSEGIYTTTAEAGAHAEGKASCASAAGAHAEGYGAETIDAINYIITRHGSIASNIGAHAEGYSIEGKCVKAEGIGAHAEGFGTQAKGNYSHAEGDGTCAIAASSHVMGMYNVEDSYDTWTNWLPSTKYTIGTKVKVNNKGYICTVDHTSDVTFNTTNWELDDKYNFIEIVGNGTEDSRANARALTWDGNEYLKGNVYVECSDNSTGGKRLATEDFILARVPNPPLANGTYTLQVTVVNGVPTYTWI